MMGSDYDYKYRDDLLLEETDNCSSAIVTVSGRVRINRMLQYSKNLRYMCL